MSDVNKAWLEFKDAHEGDVVGMDDVFLAGYNAASSASAAEIERLRNWIAKLEKASHRVVDAMGIDDTLDAIAGLSVLLKANTEETTNG